MLEFSNKITYTIIVEKTAEIIGKEPHHGRKMSLVLTDWISKDGSNFLFPCRVRNPHGATPVTLVTEMFMPGTKMAVSKLKANFELLPFPLKAFTEKCVDSECKDYNCEIEHASKSCSLHLFILLNRYCETAVQHPGRSTRLDGREL
jgi:hypothetical protein